MQISGTPQSIMDFFVKMNPEIPEVLAQVRALIKPTKREVYPYQAAALYSYAKQYNNPNDQIVELGTAYGYTVAVMAMAAPRARIIGLNPTTHEALAAKEALRKFEHVTVIEQKSWDYLPFSSVELSMVFVDGDHKRVVYDLPYWNHLRTGGLMIHHDYSPEGSGRACPPVFQALTEFAEFVGREPDESVIDDQLVGMAGWVYQKDDPVYHLQRLQADSA